MPVAGKAPRAPESRKHIDGLTAVLSTACNVRCAYCFQTERDGAVMAWGLLCRAVELLLEHGNDGAYLNITGGEPMLALPLIRRLVAYLDERRPERRRLPIAIATNGLLLDRETTRFLARNRFDVRLSFDGLAQDQRAPDSFGHIEATVLRIRREEPTLFHEGLTIVYTLTSANVGLLGDSVAYLLGLGLPSIEVFPISTHDPGWNDDTTDELERQWVRVIDLSLKHLQRTGAVPLKMLQDRPQPAARDAALCSAGRGRNLLVDVDGTVYGCTMLARSYQQLPEPWQQRLYPRNAPHITDPDVLDRLAAAAESACKTGLFHHRNLKYSSFGQCTDCPAIDSCMTCPVATTYIPGNDDPHRAPDNQCAFNRVVHNHRDRFPARSTAIDMLFGDAPMPTAMTDIVG